MIIELLIAFFAAFAFSVIFNVSKSELVFCGLVGLVAQCVYLALFKITADATVSTLLSAATATALSRILATVRKMPVTVFLLSGIISLVPGMGMYNTVYSIISSDYTNALKTGIETVKSACAIAVGIAILLFRKPAH